ncbi:hypothetical protein DNK06_02715 [Pseudomonas daroniae]|uniref:Uncharacterized protein n=1 Tax=Phytopseudomonas daroniae TaxID=2487519 RepID=A0A4Q9QSA9_9GAMM|nr:MULTISPECIES: hypothetical protein [Pseudomonas]TBU83366.1 hypothetical protein DNK06_02715 [Pseudomonas daroniae]TBU85005.1 hypothetical protein DNK31_05095 [Pseudomonas sp. FRB 228]TBU93702.1 hypothetical protein DNJ99_04975 [Pseudomonas daroniae]
MIRRLLTGSLLASLLSTPASFAGTPISEGVPIDPAASAKLIVSRDRNAPNACDLQLRVDEQLLVPIPAGESVTLDVPSGERSIVLTPSREGFCAEIDLVSSQSILLLPGETRRYQAIYEEQKLFLAPQQ